MAPRDVFATVIVVAICVVGYFAFALAMAAVMAAGLGNNTETHDNEDTVNDKALYDWMDDDASND